MQLPHFTREPLEDRSFEKLTWFYDISPRDELFEILEARRAVWLAHKDTVMEIATKLRLGLSTLVICDKALAADLGFLVYGQLRDEAFKFVRVSGDTPPQVARSTDSTPDVVADAMVQTRQRIMPGLDAYIADLAKQLTESNETSSLTTVVIVDHLDLITTRPTGEPMDRANDIVYLMAARRSVKVLAFADPTSSLPKIAEDLFTAKIEVPTLDRRDLWRLLRSDEAMCFSPDPLSVSAQLKLFQYLSGVNVIKLRQWLRHICHGCIAIGEEKDAKEIYRKIRHELTPVGELYIPDVNENNIAGYDNLKNWLKKHLLGPVRWRLEARTQEEVEKYDQLIPKGLLLYGPSGTGKTEISKWLANDLEAVLIVVRGPELKSMWHGETERAIRRIFAQARRSAPSAILVDEIDSMTPSRDPTTSSAETSMVAQFLTEMDGLGPDEPVIVIGTTNRLEAVDPAFTRPGRFGLRVHVDYPDAKSRKEILRYYFKHFGLAKPDELEKDDSEAMQAIKHLVEQTEGAIDPDDEHLRTQWRDATLRHELKDKYESFLEAAGPLFLRAVNPEFGIGDSPRWAGDHLRGVCKELARERHSHEKQQAQKPEDQREPFNLHDERILNAAIETVRRSVALDISPATQPAEPPPHRNRLSSLHGPAGGRSKIFG